MDEMQTLNVGTYGYSAVGLENLGASEYTLVTVACDISTSVMDFKNELEKAIQEIVNSCKRSPRADNLMFRLVVFNDDDSEIHGYKLLTECNIDDYKDCLHPSGSTALYDATYNSIIVAKNYGEALIDNDYNVNGILFIITDGVDNCSSFTPTTIKDEIKNIQMEENLESFVSILIGVNVQIKQVSNFLDDFKNKANLTQYVELADATEKTLAKLAQFVSKSISSQSTSLGSGQASNQGSLTI